MLERIAEGTPAGWAHADAWAERMRDWASGCERLLVLAERPGRARRRPARRRPRALRRRAQRLRPRDASARRDVDRAAHWQRYLVDEPRGWRPGGDEGSVGYTAQDSRAHDRRTGARLRRALHRGQAHRPAHRGLRPRRASASTSPRRSSSSAATRASGRASTPPRSSSATGAARRLPRRLARPRRAARRSSAPATRSSLALGARAVRLSARRGDGLRAAGDRGRPLRPGATSCADGRHGLARRARRRGRRSPTRWSRPSTTRPTRRRRGAAARRDVRGALLVARARRARGRGVRRGRRRGGRAAGRRR